PISLLLISGSSALLIFISTFRANCSIVLIVTCRFLQALNEPLISLSRSISCLVPSFLTIIRCISSLRSYVVDLKTHYSHNFIILTYSAFIIFNSYYLFFIRFLIIYFILFTSF